MGKPAWLLTDVEHAGDYSHQRPFDNPYPHLLEVGLRAVDYDLRTLAEQSWVIPWSPMEIRLMREDAPDVVREMHDASGLWADVERECVSRFRPHGVIANEMVDWVADHTDGPVPLVGSSVQHDRNWLLGWAPAIGDHLTHRIIDVSSIKALVEAWHPDAAASRPTPAAQHRVMPDLDDTTAELIFYGEHLGLLPRTSTNA